MSAPLLLWAERRRRARMVALGLFGMAVSLALCGLSGSIVAFGVAFALYAPACDLACGLAQAALMDLDPEKRERRMAAWTLAGTLGDLVAPLAIAASAAFAGFRAVWFVVALGLVLMALGMLRLELPETALESDPAESNGSWRESLRAAWGNRPLFAWLVGVMLCSLMDETLTILSALWGRERFAGDAHAVAVLLGMGTLGSVVGLMALDRLLVRFDARRLLALSCAATALSYALMLSSVTLLWASVWAFVAGAFIAWHYPIAQAQAYRAAADRSGLVAALSAPLSALELILPVLVGLVADRFGLTAALVALLIQPIGLVVVVMGQRVRAP